MDYKEIIDSWAYRIKKAKHTQSTFAQTLGMTQAALSNWITGSRLPNLQNFQKVENALRDLGV